MQKVYCVLKKRKFQILTIIISGIVFGICLYAYLDSQSHIYVSFVESSIDDDVYEVKDNNYDIFDEDYQNAVDEELVELMKEANVEQPVLIYNPYGTNNNAINIYFGTSVDEVEYKIEVDGFADYSQKLKTNEEDGYQIIGLISGKTNQVTIVADAQTYQYTFEMPESTSDIDNQIDIENGESQEELTDGLFAMMGKETRSNIFLYDNEGVLRSELIVDNDSYRTDRILIIDNQYVYTYSKKGFVFVNRQGKIERVLDLDGYYMHHDFIYDDNSNCLLVLANKNDDDTIEDYVVSLNIETGKTTELINMKDLLPEIYETAYDEDGVNTYGGDELDWIHLNSLSLMEDDSLLVSARELSTIIKINKIYSQPEIDYMIGDESIYEDFDKELDLLLEKVGDFTSQAGQHSVIYSRDDSLDKGCYYVTIYNNNFGNMVTRSSYDWSNIEGVGTYAKGTNSYFYKYLINENEGTYTLVQKIDLPYSAIVSSVEYYESHIQTCSGRDGSFGEYDSDGLLIRQYNFDVESHVYRVMKYSFDLWFE